MSCIVYRQRGRERETEKELSSVRTDYNLTLTSRRKSRAIRVNINGKYG